MRLVAGLGLLAFSTAVADSIPAAKLNPRYRDWLDGPPSLLITRTERDTFRNLANDQQRDAFIERFWETHNPAPGGPANEFKEEFYRRVAWANAHFGANPGAADGWRADMGRTWVLFGKPQSSRDYGQDPQLRPIQLWFYANPGLAELPPFFYVLFFDSGDAGGFRLYRPDVDEPQRLVRSATSNARAYETMRQISAELAHASLSLIPGEPVDTETFSGSRASARIINAIQGYSEMPSYVAFIRARGQRIAHDVPRATLVTFVAFEHGEPWVDWQLEVNDPASPKAVNGDVEYRVTSRLFANNRLVFEQTESPRFAAPEGPGDALDKLPFVYEDRMAVAPGSYRLAVTARNSASGRTYEVSKEFATTAQGEPIVLSEIVVISRREPAPSPRPFAFGGVRFGPTASGQTQAARGVSILYQIQFGGTRPAELPVEYIVASDATGFRKTFEDNLNPRRADAHGWMTIAKTLGVEDAAPGTYRLEVRCKDPESGRITERSTRFVIAASTVEESISIVVSRKDLDTPGWVASSEYERALCWLAQDRPEEAIPLLEECWKSGKTPVIGGLLQHLYEQTGQAPRGRLVLK